MLQFPIGLAKLFDGHSQHGIELREVNGVVVHYTGNPGTTAKQNRIYCKKLAETKGTYESYIIFYGLRHHNASVMLALGVPDKYAMELMGHSTNNMLKTVYQHIFEDKQNQVAQEINSFFNQTMQHAKEKSPVIDWAFKMPKVGLEPTRF